MSDNPENAVLSSEFDTSMAGLYASLVAGGLMLVYAIWYVTSLEGIDDNSFLILGLITGLTAISVIGMHEWFRHQNGADRPENPIEEYAGAIAVLMGALSSVWLTRFAVFYVGPQEKGWIDLGFQEGEVWMPVWLAALQSVCMLLVMEVSTRSIRRHSLGTLPRTVVILAPLSLAFSGIPIWLDYSRGELEIFVTLSLILLTCSAILYSLRLDRAVLYQVSSGMAVFLPIYMALRDGGSTEHAGLLIPAIVMVGITATDRSLSKEMIEKGSGVVVAAILFCQIIATENSTSFVFADLLESKYPFGLTFWLWVALLVGWFAPTTMQRTPAMPVGLALALALLADEAALIGWAVGIAAFVYLETRPQARDWVVRATYLAMIASWWVSAALGSEMQLTLATFGEYSLSSVAGSAYLLFPMLLILGMWAQRRGRLGFFDGPPVLLILASINFPLLEQSSDLVSILIVAASIYQLNLFLGLYGDKDGEFESIGRSEIYSGLITLPILASLLIQCFDDPANLTEMTRFLPISAAIALYGVCRYHMAKGANLMLRPEMAVMMLLILIFFGVNLADNYSLGSSQIVTLALLCLCIVSALLAVEGGLLTYSTPLERLVGMAYLIPAAMISSDVIVEEGGYLSSLILRDALVASAPLVVNYRIKELSDLSEEARYIGAATLIALLFLGMTDVSGGLLAIPVFFVALQRATKHAVTQVLVSLPVFAVVYASSFAGEGETVWYLLDSLPYLGETTNLLAFDTPRWASILLVSIPVSVAIHMPSERTRDGGSRYGPEELFGPAVAALFSIAFLLPDVRTAPILIVVALTAGAWKKGIANWFWFTPIASLWAFSNLIEFANSPDYFGMDINSDFAHLIGGLVGMAQYVLLERGVLLSNVENREEMAPSLDYLGPVSRAFGYVMILTTGGISGALPFISALIASWDGLRNGLPLLLHVSVVAQLVTLNLWLELGADSRSLLLWTILAGLAMIVMSWSRRNPYGAPIRSMTEPFDMEKDFGLFGSSFLLFSMYPYSQYIGFDESFGLSIVILSIHHVILGFSRDQGWRRMFSLVGMPSGLVITGISSGDLVLVLMLFLAALTLIGQAVLYASRGGLEIGSTIEGVAPIVSEIGLPSSESIETKPEESEEAPPAPEQSSEGEHHAPPEEEATPEPVLLPSPLFSSEEAPYDVRLDPSLVSNLQSTMEANSSVDLSKWKPVLSVSSNGAIVLNWEKIED